MVHFIHTADIHFGMENYGRIDPKTGIHTRLLDFKRALDFCIDYAIEQKVDFFVFSGDAYKTANPTPTQQKLLMECFFRLHEAKIPLIIVVGNHDNPLSYGKANSLELFGDLPLEGFYVVSKPTTINLNTANGPVSIVAIPWPTRNTISLSDTYSSSSSVEITEHISRAVAHIIADMAHKLDPAIPAVLASHLTVSSGIFSGSEKRAIYGTDPVLLPSQLAIFPFDYVALGHLHRYQNLNPGHPNVVYSGSIERVDFGERKEDKGFCHVTIQQKGSCSHRFIKTPTRPFIQIEVVLNTYEDHTQQLIAAIANQQIADAIVKIIYHVPAGRKDSVDLNAVQRACHAALYLVGIIPIRAQETRERRITGNAVNMNLSELLDTYFSSKAEWAEHKKDLIEKTLALEHELETEELHQ